MRRTFICTVAVLFAFLPFMTGCEDTVSKHQETKTRSDGTTVTKEEKVTRNPDGTITKTESVDVNKPDPNKDHDVKIKVDTK